MKILHKNHSVVSGESLLTEKQKEQFKEVASLYEKEFFRHLLKSLKKTIPESNLIPKNQAEKIFEDELFNQYGDLMAEKGDGLLKQMIYKNLVEKYGSSKK